jgi:single-stranded-DNA-specific exonuclease
LHDPYLMKIWIRRHGWSSHWKPGKHYGFGDYDVDGTTAVSLVSSYLKSYYPNATYIPDRYDEGIWNFI